MPRSSNRRSAARFRAVSTFRRVVSLALAGGLLLGPFVSVGPACPFCSNMGKTLAENIGEAGLVVSGTLSNAKLIPDAPVGQPDGSTDFAIDVVVKSHPLIAGKKKIQLPRYIPAAAKGSVDYLVFAEVIDGRIDPYRGMPVDSKAFVQYLAGAVKQKNAKAKDRLGYFFKYLGDPDINISGDAYKEFAAAPYKDVLTAAKSYDPVLLAAWLQDKKTPSYRVGLYGLLLGAVGEAPYAEVLRHIIDNDDSRPLTGVDGLMGGYCVLDPKKGPDYVLGVLGDPKRDFNFRYSALRTVRFILGEMPDLDRKKVFAGMAKAIHIPDISDLIIDELRKNQQWGPLDEILALYGAKKYDLQVIRRAIVRYALKCPDATANRFIADRREENPQFVADVEEILKFEEAQQVQLGNGD